MLCPLALLCCFAATFLNGQQIYKVNGPLILPETEPYKANGRLILPDKQPYRVNAPLIRPETEPYKANGPLILPEKESYTPQGGLGTGNSQVIYAPLSDFDYQSLNLALYQENIELDLFLYGLAKFSDEEFREAGLTAADRALIQFMADQEVGHATMLTNILGATAAKPCTYKYPFETVREFVDFCQKLTRFGESGVYGFLEHLDSRPAAQLLLQSITTEARQQMIFRQFGGLFPMPVWFEAGITQSMAWTLLAPYIVSCPATNLGSNKLAWQNFPALTIINNPSVTPPANTAEVFNARITPNKPRTNPLSYPGRNVTFTWEPPGKKVGPNKAYRTSTTAGAPAYIAWTSQLNTTYSKIHLLSKYSGWTLQPVGTVFPKYYNRKPYNEIYNNRGQAGNNPIVNGTMFVTLVDCETPGLNLTPFNFSKINAHIVAGPALYLAG